MRKRKKAALSGPGLRRMRAALGLTQAELARDMGVDAATVSRLESGVTPIRLRHLKLLRSVPEFDVVARREIRS